MLKKHHTFYLICLLLLLGLSGCFKEEDFEMGMLAKEQEYLYDIVAPIALADLTLSNFLGDIDLCYVDADGLVHLYYVPEATPSFLFGELIKFPDQNFPSIVTPEITYFNPALLDNNISPSLLKIDTTINFEIPFKLPNEIELDKVVFDQLKMALVISSTLEMSAILEIKFLNILNAAGDPVFFNDTFSRAESHNLKNILEGARLIFESGNFEIPSSLLKIQLRIKADLSTAKNSIDNPKTGIFSIFLSFREMDFRRLEGYFGQIKIPFMNTILVPGLENQEINGFKFDEANVMFSIKQGASIPIRLSRSTVQAFYKNMPPSQIEMFPENYEIPYPAPTDVPTGKITERITDANQLIKNLPVAFGYSIEGVSNPDKDKKIRNVIDKDSRLELSMAIDVPVSLRVDDFVFRDTIPFSISSLADKAELIQYINFKLILTNAFPVDLVATIGFYDAEMNLLIAIVEDQNIDGGEIDPNTGRVIKPNLSYFDLEMYKEDVQKLTKVAYIGIRASLSTTDGQMVKIYQEMGKEGFLGFKLGAHVKINVGGLIGGKK